MYRVKSLTGTALGSRNALRFSVCYGKEETQTRPEFAAGSSLPCPPGVCGQGSSCTGTERWHSSGCWCHQPSGPPTLLFSTSLSFIIFLPEALVVLFCFPAYGSVNLCVTLPRTQPPSLSFLWAPAILMLQFHIKQVPVINLRSCWLFTSIFTPSYTQQGSYLLTPSILLPLD